MNEEIVNGLRYLLEVPNNSGRHVIIWYDEDGGNAETLDEIKKALNDIEIIVYENNPLFVRNYVINEVPDENVIIYRAEAHPKDATSNPLIDIELANMQDVFIPNESTLTLNALGIPEMYRSVVNDNSRFFKNQKRLREVSKLKPFTSPDDLQMAIYAVLFEAEDKRMERVLAAIFCKYRADKDDYKNLLKFVSQEKLTTLLNSYFGTSLENVEDLDALWASNLITYFQTTLSEDVELQSYAKYLLPNVSNARIFIRDLMSIAPEEYRQFSAEISNEFRLEKILSELKLKQYINCDAIAIADDIVISQIIGLLDEKHDVSDMLRARETGFYYEQRQNDYLMLTAANNFYATVRQLIGELKATSKDAAEQHYADESYRVDMAYRHFNHYYDLTAKPDEYKELSQKIEFVYGEDWLLKLAEKWEASVSDENWTSTKHTMASSFYDTYLQPLEEKKDRVFVIISDGLRYEVAKELSSNKTLMSTGGEINTEYMISLLPSITPVGMAALLPHKKLTYDGKDTVLADGKKTDAGNRDAVLKSYSPDNLAVKFEEVRNMKKSDWKSFFSGKKYVYIYHDKIDITGEHDDAATFKACDQAITEIAELIADLHVTFSGVNVLVTSDHGFFYQNGTLEARRKMPKVADADKQKARYAISDNPDKTALSFRMSDMFDGNKKYISTPHANVVFAKQGGVGRYYHGGAMPQEVIVPVLNYKSSRKGSARDKVNITYSGMSLKITNAITYLTFLQNEPVSTEKMAARYKACFENIDGNKVSDEVTIIADSTAKDSGSREYREKFAFAAIKYNPAEEYYLVIKDEKDIEIDRIGFRIDIAITNDLGL